MSRCFLRTFAVLLGVLILGRSGPARADEADGHGDLSLSGASDLPVSTEWANPLGPVIQQASADYNVPAELLIALGWYGSNFEDRGGVPTVEGGYGVLALRDNILGGDSLPLAASL